MGDGARSCATTCVHSWCIRPQLLMGGNHQHKVSPDDYVMATVSIYLDIINLFLHILRILGEMRRD